MRRRKPKTIHFRYAGLFYSCTFNEWVRLSNRVQNGQVISFNYCNHLRSRPKGKLIELEDYLPEVTDTTTKNPTKHLERGHPVYRKVEKS